MQTWRNRGIGRYFLAALFGAATLTARASAFINVELRPSLPIANVGSTVSMGLYAISDSTSAQGLAAIQIIISWQPSYLQMLSNSTAGGAALLASNFPADPYGINESSVPQDGNAMYVGLASLSSPVFAQPGGTLITTLRFLALTPTSFTPINLLNSAGNPVAYSTVFDSTLPNTSVTGTLSGGGVQIVPAPAAGLAALAFGASAVRRRRSPLGRIA